MASTSATGVGFDAGSRPVDAELRLSSFDAQFLAAESGNMYSHYCGMTIFGPDAEGRSLTRARVQALVASRIDRIPPLRWRLRTVPLGLDYPSFVDGPVALEDHVIGHRIAAPGGLRELADLGAEIMAQRLDRSRPLWAFHVVEGLPEGRTAVGLKFHHAAADALGAASIAALLLDSEPDPRRRALPEPVAVGRPPGRLHSVARGAARSVAHPLVALRAGGNALPHLDQVPMMRTLPGAGRAARTFRAALRASGRDGTEPERLPKAPKLRFNGPLSPRRSVAFGRVDVATVRASKNAHGVSFNDVVVAAIAGGLRRRLLATGELPEAPLLAFVPANVRTADHHRMQGNAISSFVVPIPTDRAEATARIQETGRAMTSAKLRHRLAPPTLMDDANAIIPPLAFGALANGMMRLLGSGLVAAPLNLLISNVPGPPVRVHLDGAPMEAFFPMSLVFGGAALNVTVISYERHLEIGVVGDAELVPDAWELVEEIEAEFAELASAIPNI